MQLAFVIKNHVPYSFKVILLHQKHGKIVCIFDKKDQAALLTSGSLIWCSVKKMKNLYTLDNLEIESQAPLHSLIFMHDLMRLCLQALPSNISVPEFFDFLLYARQNLDTLSQKSKNIVFLRLFLMLDLIDEDHLIYQAAIMDPTGHITHEVSLLEKYVQHCWDKLLIQI